MVTSFTTIFFSVWVLILCFFLYVFFSKSGRLWAIKAYTGAKEVAFIGDLPTIETRTKFGFTVKQELKLYKCTGDINTFYVLETTEKNLGSMNRRYLIIDNQLLAHLNSLMQKSPPVL